MQRQYEVPGGGLRAIIVQCARPDLGTDHVYIAASGEGLRLIYILGRSDGVQTVQSEYMTYAEYPEAQGVFDGLGWNLAEIARWIEGVEIGGLRSPTLEEMADSSREQIHESTRLHTSWSTGT